jgi:hypothetical protein
MNRNNRMAATLFPRDVVCLSNICINTVHKENDDVDDDDFTVYWLVSVHNFTICDAECQEFLVKLFGLTNVQNFCVHSLEQDL